MEDKGIEQGTVWVFFNRTGTPDAQHFIKKSILPGFFIHGYFMSDIQYLCGDSFTKVPDKR
jgi:hypothetical protein